jgi:hypothetical protein
LWKELLSSSAGVVVLDHLSSVILRTKLETWLIARRENGADIDERESISLAAWTKEPYREAGVAGGVAIPLPTHA